MKRNVPSLRGPLSLCGETVPGMQKKCQLWPDVSALAPFLLSGSPPGLAPKLFHHRGTENHGGCFIFLSYSVPSSVVFRVSVVSSLGRQTAIVRRCQHRSWPSLSPYPVSVLPSFQLSAHTSVFPSFSSVLRPSPRLSSPHAPGPNSQFLHRRPHRPRQEHARRPTHRSYRRGGEATDAGAAAGHHGPGAGTRHHDQAQRGPHVLHGSGWTGVRAQPDRYARACRLHL